MGIITCLWNISDPLLRFISTFFLNTQISYSQSTACEHWNLKLHRYWRFLPYFFIFFLGEVCHSSKQYFLVSLELFYSPKYCWFFWLIFCFACTSWKYLNISSVRRHRNFYNNIISIVWMLKNRFNIYRKLYPAIFIKFLNHRCNLKR